VRPRRLRLAGLALLVVGAALLVGPTFGFETIGADRAVDADVAANEANALLGLQADYDGTEVEYSHPQYPWLDPTYDNSTVANVTNNADEALSVSVEIASIEGVDDDVLEVVNQDDFGSPVGPGATRDIRVGCSGDIAGTVQQGTTVGLSFEASGSEISIDRQPYPVTGVSFDCDGGSPGDGDPPTDPVPIDDPAVTLEASNPTAEGGFWFIPSPEVQFDLQNTGSQPVTVTGIQVSDSSAATGIEQDGAEVDVTAETNGELDADSGISIGADAPRYDFDQDATIADGQTAGVTLADFQSGGTAVDMSGESVTLVLYVEGLDVPGHDGPVPVEIQFEDI